MQLRPTIVPMLCCAAWMVTGPARADALTAALGQPLAEVEHSVAISVEDGVVVYRVERAFVNRGTRPDEVALTIDLPPGAVAVGLRIRGADAWYDGALLDADLAAERYQELTGLGTAHMKDPALLAWLSDRSLSLQLFPVAPGRTSRVAYTLIAPIDWHDGRAEIAYPERSTEAGAALAVPRLRVPAGASVRRRVTAQQGSGVVGVCGDDSTYRFAMAIASLPLPAPDVVALRYGAPAASDARRVWRLEVDAAAHLGELPRAAHVVLVLDGSRSQGPSGIAAQAVLARAYLGHLPDAQVEVIWYDRRARRQFGRFVPAAAAAARLAAIARQPFEAANGSDLDAGLVAAAGALADVGGPTRVVAMTDALVPEAFDVARAAAALAGDAQRVVHVVLRGRHDADLPALEEARKDDHLLAPIASAAGGMLLAMEGAGDARAMAAFTLQLARPTRIDDFTASAAGLDLADVVPDTLPEGTAQRWSSVVAGPAPEVVLRGKIWARAWERSVSADDGFGRRVAALVFGSGFAEDDAHLEPDEMRRLATLGGAVSPLTSYLAVEPGVRPSVAGFDISGEGCGIGGAGDAMLGSAFAERGGDNRAVLSAALADGAAACARASGYHGAATVSVETTLDEIVAVAVAASPVDAEVARCVAEATWAVLLPDARRTRDHLEVALTL
ncbi:MAG: hypothetical protein U1F43_36200 [Myxococcota bacterium]